MRPLSATPWHKTATTTNVLNRHKDSSMQPTWQPWLRQRALIQTAPVSFLICVRVTISGTGKGTILTGDILAENTANMHRVQQWIWLCVFFHTAMDRGSPNLACLTSWLPGADINPIFCQLSFFLLTGRRLQMTVTCLTRCPPLWTQRNGWQTGGTSTNHISPEHFLAHGCAWRTHERTNKRNIPHHHHQPRWKQTLEWQTKKFKAPALTSCHPGVQ